MRKVSVRIPGNESGDVVSMPVHGGRNKERMVAKYGTVFAVSVN